MAKRLNELALIDRLRNGEKIICDNCKNGIYVTSSKNIKLSHEFNCDNCGSVIRVTPGDVIVE